MIEKQYKFIDDMRRLNHSFEYIAQCLNELGYVTRRGKPYTQSNVRKIANRISKGIISQECGNRLTHIMVTLSEKQVKVLYANFPGLHVSKCINNIVENYIERLSFMEFEEERSLIDLFSQKSSD